MAELPNPGSPTARHQGCICPIWDNCGGAGQNGNFWVAADCPIHGRPVEVTPFGLTEPEIAALVDDMGPLAGGADG